MGVKTAASLAREARSIAPDFTPACGLNSREFIFRMGTVGLNDIAVGDSGICGATTGRIGT